MSLNFDDLSNQISQLPVFPRLLHHLMDNLRNESVGLKQIAKIIASDQAIGARVIKMANTAAYRRSKEITSIEEASLRLGAQSLHSIVVASFLVNAFPSISEQDREDFWCRTFFVATLAKGIASKANLDPEAMFTCGMLYNIGDLIILMLADDHQKQGIQGLIEQGQPKIAAQRQILEADYRQIGTLLGRTWHFPQLFIRCIAQHLTPLDIKPVCKEACLIGLSLQLAELINGLNEDVLDEITVPGNEVMILDLLEHKLSSDIASELELDVATLVKPVSRIIMNKKDELEILFA